MQGWENAAGQALSSAAWLEAHHRAKLPERTRFAQSLVRYQPRRVVDLGCGTGLWLDLIDKVLPSDCEFVGIDCDSESLNLARVRAESWTRKADFIVCDLVEDFSQVPSADLMLVFNLLPYLPNASEILMHFKRSGKVGRIVVRQYDGGTMRVGPLASAAERQAIDISLRESLEERGEPSHYDIDSAYELAHASGIAIEMLDFELTQRHAPFPPEFVEYFEGTIAWMSEHLPADAQVHLKNACSVERECTPIYFVQVDLIAVLSNGGRVVSAPVQRRTHP